MATLSKRIMVPLFAPVLLTTAGMGRNAAHGFGKDMSATGQGIQNGTK